MFSTYQKRLETFKEWPNKFKNFVKKLAIMGQYSIDPKTFSTRCIYCKKEISQWNINDIPLQKHMENNDNKCSIFKLKYLRDRKKHCTVSKELLPEDNEYLNRKFIKTDFSEPGVFLCMRCGSDQINHQCDGKIDGIFDSTNLETAQFYIKYLNGCFIDQIELYNKVDFELNENQKEILRHLLNSNKSNICAFKTLESFIEENSEKIYQELEKKMKSIENTAIENIYNESMLI